MAETPQCLAGVPQCLVGAPKGGGAAEGLPGPRGAPGGDASSEMGGGHPGPV